MLCFTLLYAVALCVKMRYVILCIKRLLIEAIVVLRQELKRAPICNAVGLMLALRTFDPLH